MFFLRNGAGDPLVMAPIFSPLAAHTGYPSRPIPRSIISSPTSLRFGPPAVTSYGHSAIRPELANTEDQKHTIRIDTKLLAEAESGNPRKGKKDFAEELAKSSLLSAAVNPASTSGALFLLAC